MTYPKIHRVVTGHDSEGRSIVSSNGPLTNVFNLDIIPGLVLHEVWNTTQTPTTIDNGVDPANGPLKLGPPKNGTKIRFADIPPETEEFRLMKLHPYMHISETIDYSIVMEGEITLILDDSEVDLQKGAVVIQRGTNHAWANRSSNVCRMLYILIDGQYDPSMNRGN
jgi:mannose-6-phosphate isomerase-like protein (cupin superfamily)